MKITFIAGNMIVKQQSLAITIIPTIAQPTVQASPVHFPGTSNFLLGDLAGHKRSTNDSLQTGHR